MNETWWRKASELDPDQTTIVSLPLDGSHLVVGPPGSGKTNLLLLRATFLSRAGTKNIAIITFNRMLREFIASGADNYPFEPERIQTFRTWGANFIRSQGGNVDTNGDFDTVRQRIIEGLEAIIPTLGEEAKLDCILIDEAQDYRVREIEIMRALANDVFAVGDNRQRIYENDGALDYLATFCAAAPPLKHHYRNGTAICRFADGVMNLKENGMLDTSNYDEATYPSTVSRDKDTSIADQIQKGVPIIETQLLAYPGEWIGVLSYLKKDVAAAFAELSKSSLADKVQLQKYEDGYEQLDPDRPIIVTTMHSAKGLEFRAVHLIAVDSLMGRQLEQKIAFTAATRAKTSLSLYHRGAAPGYIERGLTAVKGAPLAPPSMDDLFGGVK